MLPNTLQGARASLVAARGRALARGNFFLDPVWGKK